MYRAILISIGLVLLCCIVEAITGLHYIIVSTMVLGTAIWAGVDASRIESQKYKAELEEHPIMIFFLVLLLWIVFFPWYLSKRKKVRDSGKAELLDKYEGEAFKGLTMKKQIICRNCGSVGLPKKRYGVRLILALISWTIPVLNLLGTFEEFKSEQNELTMRGFIELLTLPYDPQASYLYGGLDLDALRISIIAPFVIWWSIALILTIWILVTRRTICSKCGAKKNLFVPLDTPEGERLLSQSEEARKILQSRAT